MHRAELQAEAKGTTVAETTVTPAKKKKSAKGKKTPQQKMDEEQKELALSMMSKKEARYVGAGFPKSVDCIVRKTEPMCTVWKSPHPCVNVAVVDVQRLAVPCVAPARTCRIAVTLQCNRGGALTCGRQTVQKVHLAK